MADPEFERMPKPVAYSARRQILAIVTIGAFTTLLILTVLAIIGAQP